MNDATPGRALAEIKRAPLIVHDESVLLDTGRFEQLQRVAALMATAKLVPTHLQNSPGDCFMVCQQAVRWQMDPFAVAQKTHVIQGRLGYEAQLIAAVVNSRAPLASRLNVRFEGEGESLVCVAFATMAGEDKPREKASPKISAITTKNSPLWKIDPAQQLAYWTMRAWARLHCPDVLLGVYTADELDAVTGQVIDHEPLADTSGRPTIESSNASPPEPVAEMTNPYPLVDETGVEFVRCATVDDWAKELKARAAPIDGKLQAKAQAYLRNNAEAYQAVRGEIADDKVVEYLDKLYAAIAGAKKAAPAPEPQPPTQTVLNAIELPMKGGKVDGAAYTALIDAALTGATAKEQVIDILAVEAANMKKLLPGHRRAIRNNSALPRWLALGGEQDAFAAPADAAMG